MLQSRLKIILRSWCWGGRGQKQEKKKSFLYLKVFFHEPHFSGREKAYCWLTQTICLSQRLFSVIFLLSPSKRRKENFYCVNLQSLEKFGETVEGNSGKRKRSLSISNSHATLRSFSFIFKFNLEEKLALYSKSSATKAEEGRERKFFAFNLVEGRLRILSAKLFD